LAADGQNDDARHRQPSHQLVHLDRNKRCRDDESQVLRPDSFEQKADPFRQQQSRIEERCTGDQPQFAPVHEPQFDYQVLNPTVLHIELEEMRPMLDNFAHVLVQ
jgi:hypothetical protein